MKENFYLEKNLNLLKEQMEQHQPYATMVVSTTGITENDMPLRVQIRQFEYDEEKKQYLNPDTVNFDTNKGMSFDATIQLPDDLINDKIKQVNEGGYDIFKKASINIDEYKNGLTGNKPTLSIEEFQKAFENITKCLEVENTLLIVNGLSNAEKNLANVNCSLAEMKANEKVIDQLDLSKEYIGSKEGIEPRTVSLSDLADKIEPLPSSLLQKFDEKTVADFNSMSKENFCSAHTDISNTAYDLYAKRIEMVASERLNIMNKMINKFGTEQKILPNKIKQIQINGAEKYKQTLSESGKAKFANSSLTNKLNFFIKQGFINKEDIENRTSEFEKLGKALTQNEPEKDYVCFLHMATTDRDEGNQPLRLQAKIYKLGTSNDGIATAILKKSVAELDQIIPSLSSRVINNMDKNKEYSGFNDAHLPVKNYVQGLDGEGKPLPTMDEATKNIKNFFNPAMLNKCNIVVAGGEDFYKNSLKQVMDIDDLYNKPFINVLKSVQEYAYGLKEGIFNNDISQKLPNYPCLTEIKGFKLPELGQSLGKKNFDVEKIDLPMKLDIVSFVSQALGAEYSYNYLEEVKERQQKNKDNQQKQQEVKEEKPTKEENTNTPVKEEESEGSFDYDTIETVQDKDLEKNENEQSQSVDDYGFEEVKGTKNNVKEDVSENKESANDKAQTSASEPAHNDNDKFFEENSNNNLEKLAENTEKIAEEKTEEKVKASDSKEKEPDKKEGKAEEQPANRRRMRNKSSEPATKISKEKAENLIPEPKDIAKTSDNVVINQLLETNNRLMEVCNSLTEQNNKLMEQNSRLSENLIAVVQQNSMQTEKLAELANGVLNSIREQNAITKGMMIASNPEIATMLKEVMEVKNEEPSIEK